MLSLPVVSDIFCLFYNAADKTVKGVNGSGRSPKALTMDYVRSKGINGRTIPLTGELTYPARAVESPRRASGRGAVLLDVVPLADTFRHFVSDRVSFLRQILTA